MLKKPKKPYKNREEAQQSYSWGVPAEKLTNDFYPCHYCNGSGRVYNEDDYDPIEGYKMARTFKCSCCDGTGNWGKSLFEQWYKIQINSWKKDLDTYNDIESKANKAISKLTSEDIYYLQKWWEVK